MRIERSAPRTTANTTNASTKRLPISTSVAPGPALAGEQHREQDDRAEVGDRPGGHDELTELRLDLPGVLEHGDDHAERRRREDHRDEQRRLGEPAGA